eukprot:TRINITY_DN1891_c0_g2_i1.p1 TRINITY_DN1891_c0_g2~~TRINITY_DN1891_c0_g2_i1.p1  ORF type:complete len:257 (-),score=84.57 TRINITY_DN1891_c0_g2_i1:269-1003(-)
MLVRVGKPAPAFEEVAVMEDKTFKKVKLSDYAGKYLVLFFYPLDFTFVCPTELVSFSDRIEEFKALNCNVVGASVDSQYSHLAWISTPRKEGGLGGKLNYPLISDLNKKMGTQFGVLSDDGDTYRGLFIISDKGLVRHFSITDYEVGRDVSEVIRLVKAFQTSDSTGLVCPAGWSTGQALMKPDPEGSKEFFSTLNETTNNTVTTNTDTTNNNKPKEKSKRKNQAPSTPSTPKSDEENVKKKRK